MPYNYLKNNNANEFDDNSSVLVKPSDPIVKRPPLYHVVLLNDDYTPMEFVIYVLQSFFGFDKEKATQIMLSVHTKGKGICGVFTREVAETKSMHINNFAQQNEHPLISEIEPAEDE
jgi:ATP-dependent Clp protease adaptor protein ClpS